PCASRRRPGAELSLLRPDYRASLVDLDRVHHRRDLEAQEPRSGGAQHEPQQPPPHRLLAERELRDLDAGVGSATLASRVFDDEASANRDPDRLVHARGWEVWHELGERGTLEKIPEHGLTPKLELAARKVDDERAEGKVGRLGEMVRKKGVDLRLAQDHGVGPRRATRFAEHQLVELALCREPVGPGEAGGLDIRGGTHVPG